MTEKEKYLNDYPKPITLKSTENIFKQMKNNICKIHLKNGNKGTGFFCKIKYNNESLSVLMTNNHILDNEILEKEENLTISINNKKKNIELKNRNKYTNVDYDITIIEIKNKDNINSYLELDDDILENISNIPYINESIYIIQYEGEKEEASVSYGILQNIDEEEKYAFEHLCSTKKGSSGSPILNIKNNKIIGIHKGSHKNNNIGTFINYPIKEFIDINNISDELLFRDGIFSFLNEKQKLNLIIYNKKLQKLLRVDIEDYKRISGKYKIGKRKGNGKGKEYILKRTNLIFEGEYINGKRNGKGKEYENDKLIFEGEYLNGKKWNGIIYNPSDNMEFDI